MSADEDIVESTLRDGKVAWIRVTEITFSLPNPDSVIHITLNIGVWPIDSTEQSPPFRHQYPNTGREVVQVNMEFASRFTTVTDPFTGQSITMSGAGLSALLQEYITRHILPARYGRGETTPSGRFVIQGSTNAAD